MIKIPEKISVPLVSAFVLMVLILQSFSGFVNTGRWGWPFVAYPMYKLAHQDGERILHDFTLYAKLPDGKLVEVTRDELGMGFWHFEKHVANPMLENHQEKMLSLADEYC